MASAIPLGPQSYPLNPIPFDGDDIEVLVDGDEPEFDQATGTLQIPLPDGQVQIIFGEQRAAKKSQDFYDNLAEDLAESDLSAIAEKILRGIEQDEQSRSNWLENMSNGISLLGLEVKNPRGAAASGATPTEGVSTVDHPLLLEAVLRFQANARGELLPADGPVKVRNDGEGDEWSQRLADALQKDLNHYLTVVAEEYYPDTDKLLFLLGFCGIGFKKGFHCPLKRRPVIESIDAKDLIVSNASTNIGGAGRVTHRIMMRPSTLRRMQLVGAYLDTRLPLQGLPAPKNPVDAKIDQTQGIAPATYIDTDDQDRELYECYCETEIPGYEHRDRKGDETGLPLPYKVTIDKEARRILEIRRNWEEDDDLCLPRNRIIAYIFVPGLGFYGIGLLNILGNATKAVTAAWRLMIDAGMFANFPGFLYIKSLAKQLTNQFRIPPGGGMPIDTMGGDIRSAVMPLPYKDPSAVFIQLIDNITVTAQRVGGTAELQIGEGKQDAPVGTTLALIEQATKVMSAVHKRLHNAQAREFMMLKELLTEDPSALWRHNKKSKVLRCLMEKMGQKAVADAEDDAQERQNAIFIAALNDVDLIPAADPNTSSQTERYLKITALKQIQASNPNIDQNEVDLRAMKVLGFQDAESLFKPPPPPGTVPPNPEEMTAQATLTAAQARIQDAQSRMLEAQTKAHTAQIDAQNKAAELASRERIANMGIAREAIIHQSDQTENARRFNIEQQQRSLDRVHKFASQRMQHAHDALQTGLAQRHEAQQAGIAQNHELLTSGLDKFHEAAQGGVVRAHEAREAHIDRTHEAIQSHADRAHQVVLNHMNLLAKDAQAKPKKNGSGNEK